MDTGASEQWVVSRDGSVWIDALTEGNAHIQSRATTIEALELALQSPQTKVIFAQDQSASGAAFLGDVARKMSEQTRDGDYDWSDQLAPVVQTLIELDPLAQEDYRDLLATSPRPGERCRP